MATAEERMQILKMIEQKMITAEEGARLLSALSAGRKEAPGTAGQRGGEPRWFRVRVTDLNSGRSKVSVNIPMSLVHVALKTGARFAPNIEGFDFNQVVEAIRSGAQGKVVDVIDDEDGERVEIYVE